jgi:hypothetical protein
MTEEQQDFGDIERLDQHFADQRAAAACATRAAARGTVIKRAGVGALLGGAGLGCAAFGASFLFALPKVDYRSIEVPRISYRDVTADHVVVTPVPVEVPKIAITPVPVDVPKITVKDVPIEIPRVVTSPAPAASAPVASAPLPRTPQEEGFERSTGWREAVIRGRILRPDGKGFILGTDAGEQGFYPAEVDAAGGVELRQAFKDDVAGLLGDLCACRKLPNGMYRCVALHQGAEVEVPQVPIGAPL